MPGLIPPAAETIVNGRKVARQTPRLFETASDNISGESIMKAPTRLKTHRKWTPI